MASAVTEKCPLGLQLGNASEGSTRCPLGFLVKSKEDKPHKTSELQERSSIAVVVERAVNSPESSKQEVQPTALATVEVVTKSQKPEWLDLAFRVMKIIVGVVLGAALAASFAVGICFAAGGTISAGACGICIDAVLGGTLGGIIADAIPFD